MKENIPNRGQIPNLPYGAVVETNAVFRGNLLTPVQAGDIPPTIYPMLSGIVGEQRLICEAGRKKDLEAAYRAFVSDPLMRISLKDSKALFNEMTANTAEYLTMYR